MSSDDEDTGFPNFNHAYPTTATDPATQSASWHPALRPHDAGVARIPPTDGARPADSGDGDDDDGDDDDDEFFERYPGATPKKAQPRPPAHPHPHPQAPPPAPHAGGEVAAGAIEVARAVHVHAEPAEQVGGVDMGTDAAAQGPVTRSGHEEAGVGSRDQRAAAPREGALEAAAAPEQSPADPEEAARRPERGYDYQGEVTEMDAAVEEEPQAPLLPDDEAAPAVPEPEQERHVSPAPSPSRLAAPPPLPPIDRSFTTNFTDPAPRAAVPHAPVPGDDATQRSVSGADDKTFGELLDHPAPSQPPAADPWPAAAGFAEADDDPFAAISQQTAENAAAAQAPAAPDGLSAANGGTLEAPVEAQAEDLAAAWQAALDDDELLGEGLDDDLLPDDAGAEEAEAGTADLDPTKFFGEDDEGLLADDDGFLSSSPPAAPMQQQQPPPPQPTRAPSNRDAYRPAGTPAVQQARANPYAAPATPFTTTTPNLGPNAHSRAAGTPDTGLFDLYNSLPVSPPSTQTTFGQLQQQRPQAPQTAQSFVDKAKGGYQSPYDLPMEVVKVRKRPPQVPQQQPTQGVKAPPRTSSFGAASANAPEGAAGAPPRRQGSTSSQDSAARPPSSSGNLPPPNGVPSAARSTPKPAASDSGFFADLPVRERPSRGWGAYTPQQPGDGSARPGTGPPQQHQMMAPPGARGPLQQQGMPPVSSQMGMAPPAPVPGQQDQQQQQQQQQQMFGGLRQPEKMPLLPDQPTAPQQQPGLARPPGTAAQRFSPAPPSSAPVANKRYSPAPSAASAQQPPTSRYSPAPAQQQQQQRPNPAAAPPRIPSTHQYAPRTSSPLAYSLDKPQPPLPSGEGMMASPPPMPMGVAGSATSLERRGFVSPPSGQYQPSHAQAPHTQASQAQPTQPPPTRPRTQSPISNMKASRFNMTSAPEQRPGSAGGTTFGSPLQSHPSQTKGPVLPHRRQFSRELSFAAPTDDRVRDPLERWKGHPIFHWSATGAVLTSFPKQTPFYAPGTAVPSLKCTAGDIRVQDAGAVVPLEESTVKFPGPLAAKTKGRKKEVVAWMGGKIEELARRWEDVRMDYRLDDGEKKRVEEKVVLWRLMKVFVENDMNLDSSNPKIDAEIRSILLPDLADMGRVMDLQTPASATLTADPVDKSILSQIRHALLSGDRSAALLIAEEKKLWGHALLIASTLGAKTWKQIVSSFIRSQLGSEARSLAATYQVFAGNWEECVDELVPPSARAGFRMVSTVDGRQGADPLVGLEGWREVLGMVVGNRMQGSGSEGASLVSLGKLLSGYGRAEAAAVCFLFARQAAKISGADDQEGSFVLFGEKEGADLDAVMLTEIYEWAMSSLAASAATTMSAPAHQLYLPHLQAYKLLHAQLLAAHGQKATAQAYCEHITAAYTSTTRPSQYYHPAFTDAVTELSAILSQSPPDAAKRGLLSRPAMKNVTSGAASWFTKFVAGDEDPQAAENAAASMDESGPFGRVSGEISRNPSATELYNPLMAGAAPVPAAGFVPGTAPQGRYTPGYSPAVTAAAAAPKPMPLDGTGGSRYMPGVSSGESSAVQSPTNGSALGVPAFEHQHQHQRPVSAPRATSRARYAPAGQQQQQQQQVLGVQNVGLNVPRPDGNRAASEYGGYAPRRGSTQTVSSTGSYEPSPSLAQEPSPYAYQPSPLVAAQQANDDEVEEEDAFGPKINGLPESEEDGGGYQPPSYEAPAYTPYEPEPDAEADDETLKPRKKRGPMDLDDDEDDMAARAAALKKAQADRVADEAFRRAAEADAAKDDKKAEGKGKGGGWLGGWFKKDPSAELNKPIKAKLGEESSFYYDETLKKWVNKKGGSDAATPAAATPPPPKGPPSRMASGAMGPPSGPPSRAASAAAMAGPPPGNNGRPPTSGSMAPGSGPPSRAGTPAGGPGALEGVPGSGLGGSNGDGGPPSRPGTSMSAASSLDDLLAVGPRNKATVKRKAKGRYVDVMAK